MNPELQSKIEVWKRQAAEGALSEAQMLEVVRALREGRMGAAIASEVSRKSKAKAAPVDGNDLLGEMMA